MSSSDGISFPKRIGRYELLGKIASGGMATVYLGRAYAARGFERVVAIKKLHPALEQDADVVSMFFEEARLAARIRHPNVVSTMDVDDGDGHCIVMEYVEGDQLLGLLRATATTRKRIPTPVVLRIAIDVLSGLHAAHELTNDDGRPLRLVHRDVSPHNVLVGVDGISKVTDFGIAKIEDATYAHTGLKGKLAYMAPEQANRERVDRRADVFAAGIVIWELFTARRLFSGETSTATLASVLSGPIPSLEEMVDLPRPLSDVIAKALERHKERRWQTAAEFAEALDHAAASGGGVAPAKVVAEHISMVSGDKIERERNRLRSALGQRRSDATPSSSQAGERQGGPAIAHEEPTVVEPTVLGSATDVTFAKPPVQWRAGTIAGMAAAFAIVAAGAAMLGSRFSSSTASAIPAAAPSSSIVPPRDETPAQATPSDRGESPEPSASASATTPSPPKPPPAAAPSLQSVPTRSLNKTPHRPSSTPAEPLPVNPYRRDRH